MVTGDQAATARNVAEAVGLDGSADAAHGGDLKPPDDTTPREKKKLLHTSMFVRMSPKQKLDLISLHQEAGSVVAMTGDGINDAPALAFGLGKAESVTVSFLTLAFARLWHVFNMKDPAASPTRNQVVRNRYVWGALGLCAVLIMLAVTVPCLSAVLDTVWLSRTGWLLVGVSLAPLLAGQAAHFFISRVSRSGQVSMSSGYTRRETSRRCP